MTTRIAGIVLSLIFLLAVVEPLVARPEYLMRFQADPFRRPDVDGCATCHLNPQGGGQRNEFGMAFAEADHMITPMLRANFPNNFKFETMRLANGLVFYFSDPENKFVVFEREKQRALIDLTAILNADKKEDKVPPAENRMSFFITSKGLGNGGHLGGLGGADQHCQELAQAVGAGDRTWRAYLSTSFQGQPAVNAGDRIGNGPWYNAKRVLIARGVADLHKGNRLNKETALNEKGETINGIGDQPNRHDILTGSLPDGTAAVGMNCNNWSSNAEGNAIVGHHDRMGTGEKSDSWNSAHPSAGCSQQALQSTGGDGLFYCFEAR